MGGGWDGDLTFTPQIYMKYDYVEKSNSQGWVTVSASNAVKIPFKSPPIPQRGIVGHAVDRCIIPHIYHSSIQGVYFSYYMHLMRTSIDSLTCHILDLKHLLC